MASQPEIILYTNHGCPWAHRAQIALAELSLPFETTIIDLETPRPASYLAVNPRGLVPALSYNGTIITESGIVAQFLADAHPSHLVKASNEEGGALQRAKIAFFVDAWLSKVQVNFIPALKGEGESQTEALGKVVAAIERELEPLLGDAGPYFGGSGRLTMAEVLTAPFVLRLLAFSKYDYLLPATLSKTLEEKTPKFWKWANAVVQERSVTYSWDEKTMAEKTAKRLGKK